MKEHVKISDSAKFQNSSGFEINGCPVVPDNQKYAGATK